MPQCNPTSKEQEAESDQGAGGIDNPGVEMGSSGQGEPESFADDRMEWECDEIPPPQTAEEGPGAGKRNDEPLHCPKGKPTRGRVQINEYPDPCAGAPVHPERFKVDTCDFAKHELADPKLFETAHWLGNLPISDQQRGEFFQHENNQHLPWKNHDDFDTTVDSIPHGPPWFCHYVEIEGEDGVERYKMFACNLPHGVEYLLSNQQCINCMRYAPKIHWLCSGCSNRKRLYSEMWTAQWWWQIQTNQSLLAKGATVVLMILSSDETQLSILGSGQAAWPLYLLIGNISKKVRR